MSKGFNFHFTKLTQKRQVPMRGSRGRKDGFMKVSDLRFVVIGEVELKQGYSDEYGRQYRRLNKPCKISELPEGYLDLEVKYMFVFSDSILVIQVEDALDEFVPPECPPGLPFSEEVTE